MQDEVIKYWHAKDAYDEAERALARARTALAEAEREARKEWDRLVATAEALPDNSRAKVAAAQFCGEPRF